MTLQIAIAGAGIGGLAAALACARAGNEARVSEQAAEVREYGAGIQLGPNVTRILRQWGVGDALAQVAGHPQAIFVRDAVDGRELASLALAGGFAARYGAHYLTIHRADLQSLLLDAARACGVEVRLGAKLESVEGALEHSDALIAADGVWTTLRAAVVADGPARPTGHLAYRALLRMSAVPVALRASQVTAWLAPRMHVVTYPVRGGEMMNIVALVESDRRDVQGWNDAGTQSELAPLLGSLCMPLRGLLEGVPQWGVWSLHDRLPVSGPQEMAKGRVALVGDAAHPMLPYLAQGAGMAIEDADMLAACLAGMSRADVEPALARYAQARWQRCARVQAGARRNAVIFHAAGALRFARNAALRLAGERLVDQPWLYAPEANF